MQSVSSGQLKTPIILTYLMPGLGGRWRWGVNSLIFSGGSLNCDPFQLYLGNIFFMMYIPWGIIWLLLHVGVSNKTKESSMTWVLVTGRQRSRGGGLKSWLPTKSFLLSSFRDVHLPGLSPWKDHVSLEPNHGPPAPPSRDGPLLWKMDFTQLSVPACHSVNPRTFPYSYMKTGLPVPS